MDRSIFFALSVDLGASQYETRGWGRAGAKTGRAKWSWHYRCLVSIYSHDPFILTPVADNINRNIHFIILKRIQRLSECSSWTSNGYDFELQKSLVETRHAANPTNAREPLSHFQVWATMRIRQDDPSTYWWQINLHEDIHFFLEKVARSPSSKLFHSRPYVTLNPELFDNIEMWSRRDLQDLCEKLRLGPAGKREVLIAK